MTSVLVWCLPLLPVVAGLIGLLLPLTARLMAGWLAIAGVAMALVVAVLGFLTHSTVHISTVLADFGDIAVTASVQFNARTAAVAIAVTLVATLVQIYSRAYLRDDDRYVPYAAQVSLFTAAMLLVVVADDLILLLIGWEVMGACSYLLIGHDRKLRQAPAAAVKAFLVTRVGDVGFLLGILLLGIHAGTFRIGEILNEVSHFNTHVMFAAALLILAGAVGKSAQFPLHTWLPDAMAGPTPISALIHAATMVAAGAYVLMRLLPLYQQVPAILTIMAVLAAISMVMAACAALCADDLKRVLAWSTVSQVGFMFGAVAVAAPDAALFHLLSHAAFKALLFLGAGVVIHMVNSNSMTDMGGLRRGAPITFWTMTLGFAALAGIPPLAGFWSKESVLGAAHESPAGGIVWVAGLVTVVLTGAYCARAWLRTFFGHTRSQQAKPHDSEPSLSWPLLVLAVPTAGLGLLNFGTLLTGLPSFHLGTSLIVLVAVAVGVATTYVVWRNDSAADPSAALGPVNTLFASGFYLDELQHRVIVRPIQLLAQLVKRGDERVVDGAIENSATITGVAARGITLAHNAGIPRYLLLGLAGIFVVTAATVAAVWGAA